MGYFPFFIELEGTHGLIVGGGKVAVHKVEKLLPFGADLTVIAPKIMETLQKNPAVYCEERPFLDQDIEGKLFVIAATGDETLNAHISQLCKNRGILVNVVDDKEKCGFLFPALVKEGKLTAGISTAGASPQIAATLRSRLSQELPEQIEEQLDYLNGLRDLAKEKIPDAKKRAAFLKEMADFCMERNKVPTGEETEKHMDFYRSTKQAALSPDRKEYGSVTLVGAGCGAFDLITVRGLNAVRKAETLVYDDLLDERLLEHTSESCERIYVGKRMGQHSMPQDEINRILIEKAKEGKRVVRLKGGDPFVFGRGGEEMLVLQKEGILVSEIPGITSAVAVPAAAGIPVTQRGLSRSFHVITAHTAKRGNGLPENMEHIAKLDGTCIFLMGFHQLEKLVQTLMYHGKSKNTPAAVVHGNADGTVMTVRGNLNTIVEKVNASGMKTPAVILVGETAAMELNKEH